MKKVLLFAMALAMLICLTSCGGGDDVSSGGGSYVSSDVSIVSSEETVVQKTYFKQSEPVEVAYEAGNPATAPVILTEIPSTWKLSMRITPGVDFCTMDTINTYREEVGEKNRLTTTSKQADG